MRRLFPDWKLLAERREEAADTALRQNGSARRMLLAILMENGAEETDAVRGLDRAHILLDALHQGEMHPG